MLTDTSSVQVSPFPKGFFTECEPATSEGICAVSTSSPQKFGDKGTCIPSSAQVLFCSLELDNCICPIRTVDTSDPFKTCKYQLSIIDIYIVNKTDQKLHLVSKDTNIKLKVDDASVLGCTATLPTDPNFGNFLVGWIASPPNTIDICDTILIRGAVGCASYQPFLQQRTSCCKSDVTLQIDAVYNIGVGDDAPRLTFSTCRNKPRESDDSICQCQDLGLIPRNLNAVACKTPFGAVDFCGGTPTINPTTSIYSVVSRINASQAVLSVVGGSMGCTGTTPVGCTGDKGCPDNERCVDFKCVSRTGTTGCSGNVDCPGKEICVSNICVKSSEDNRQFIILVSVSAVVVIVIFGFLFFLLSLSRSKKKAT